MESICATRESVEGSHFITSVCFYLVGCTVRVRLSTLILSFFAAESRDTSLTRFSLCVPICHTAHLHHMTEFGLRKACGGARRHQPLWETPRRSEWSYRSGFSNIYPFSPYVTPHSPHISEFNSIFSAALEEPQHERHLHTVREAMRACAAHGEAAHAPGEALPLSAGVSTSRGSSMWWAKERKSPRDSALMA